ncbi:MAG: trypsin-like peptidase domain-containing protein [bacterium]
MTATGLLTSAFSDETTALAARLDQVLVTVRSDAGGGSGTAWSEDGLIVTNHHVVPGDRATVVLADGSEHDAVVEDRDPDHDLALLRIKATLTPATPGDSHAVRPGSLVFAIGNPWGQRGTLTSGIVFARGASNDENTVHIADVIRADLTLAPGNSGGPMVNAAGEVVGINSMIAGGMAVAIPSHSVVEFVGRSEPGEPGFLGITIQPVQVPHAIAASYQVEDEAALMLTGIEPGSPAEQAGLLPGDVVLGIGKRNRGLRHLAPALRSMRAGHPLDLHLLRGGKVIETHATPIARN